jgi:serine/threonine-protein kinase
MTEPQHAHVETPPSASGARPSPGRASTVASTVASTGMVAPAKVRPRDAANGPGAAAEEREHRASVRRLRYVLGVGLLLWNVIGIPNDVQVTTTFGLSYAEFTWARAITTLLQVASWSLLFLPSLSPPGLRAVETVVFVSTSAGLAALNHGIAGPTLLFVSCALIAQGASVPRPWREGLPSLGATLVTYPLTLWAVHAITGRNAGQWADVSQRFALLHGLFLASCTLIFVVLAGDALHGLRRRALGAERVGRYRLVTRLGGGGMGEVWRARHPGLDQDVALKLASTPAAEARLAEEASILGKLVHPSTVRLLDRGRGTDGRFYYAMELLRGQTLEEVVAREGPLDEVRTREVGLAVARALAEAHARGIVHRDVKPENVMCCEGGFVKLLDFGVATRDGAAASAGLVGSPRFMAPEQRMGAGVDARADVFGLGATLYFALEGASPLDADEGPRGSALDAAYRRLAERGTPLASVIAACLARAPAERPPDGARLAEALFDATPVLDATAPRTPASG